MGNKYYCHDFNPFFFPSTLNSYSQLPLSSSSSSSSSSPASYSSSYSCPSSPSLNSPFQSSNNSQASSASAAAFGPCAACKLLRQQCTDKCYLASYFPSIEPLDKFTIVDSLSGVSNIIKFLQKNGNSMPYVPVLFLLKDSTSQDHERALLTGVPQRELSSSSHGDSDIPRQLEFFNPSLHYNTTAAWLPQPQVQTLTTFTRIARGKENRSGGNRRCEDALEIIQKRPKRENSLKAFTYLQARKLLARLGSWWTMHDFTIYREYSHENILHKW